MAKKPIEFDTARWLKDDLGFTDTEVRNLAPLFDARKDKVAEGFLRQSDYSRSIADVQKLQTDLQAKDQQLNKEMAEWAALQAGDEEKAVQLRKDLETTRLEKFQLEQRIKTYAETNGIDPAALLPEVKPGQEPPKPPAAEPDARYVGRDQFGVVVDYMLSVPAELAAIAAEHYDLTGERLDTRPLVADLKARIAKKQPADLRAIWEEKFQVPAKREARTKAKYEEDIAAAEARGREAARSEASLPGQHPAGVSSPIFTQTHKGPENASKLQRPQPHQTTRSFAESLRSRKYAPGPAAHPAPGSPGAQK